MVDAVRVKLKPEQLEGIDKQLDAAFEENMVPELMKSTKCQSVAELEQLLQKYGLSLPQMRKRWGDQQIALQWIKTKAGNDPMFSREELIAAYEKRLKDYTVVGQVKWQQIQVNTARHGGDRDEARAVLLQAMKALVAGESFDEVAKKFSEAPSRQGRGPLRLDPDRQPRQQDPGPQKPRHAQDQRSQRDHSPPPPPPKTARRSRSSAS